MKLERMMGYTGALNTECQHFSNRTIIRGAQEWQQNCEIGEEQCRKLQPQNKQGGRRQEFYQDEVCKSDFAQALNH